VARLSIFRPVVGYEGLYLVSDRGEVRSLARKRVDWRSVRQSKEITLRPVINKQGYGRVHLYDHNSKPRSFFVHRLVLEAFVGPCPKGMECRHYPDNNPANNKLSNLQWGTKQEQHKDREVHRTSTRGSQNPRAKLDEDKIREARRIREEKKWTYKRLGKKFGVSTKNIHFALTGRSWKHVA